MSSSSPKRRHYQPCLENLEDRCLMSASSERFVARLYRDLLMRAVDGSGRSFWSTRIDQGNSPSDVVTQIAASDEYRNGAIESYYSFLLGRSSDPAGRAGIQSLLKRGLSLDQVRAVFFDSPEYQQTRTDGTAKGFLDAVYQDILGRNPDPAGQAFWLDLLGKNATHLTVAQGILTSAESAQAMVNLTYQQFLHRSPDQEGAAHWVGLLQQGAPLTTVIAGIAGSAEYLTQSATQDSFTPMTPRNDFVFDSYGVPLSETSSASAHDIVMSYMQQHQAEMGLSDTDMQGLVTTDQYTDSDTSVTHIYMMQTVYGIGIPAARMSATIDSDGRIMSYSNSLVPYADQRINASSPMLGVLDGMTHIMDQMGMHPSQPMTIVSRQSTPDQQMMLSDAGGLTQSENPAHLIYEPMPNGSLHLSWNVNMNMAASINWWNLTVDAETGQLLRRDNWTDDATFNVFANPLRSPAEGNRSIQPDVVGAASPFGWQDTNGVAGEDTFFTNGNNVTASYNQLGRIRIPMSKFLPGQFDFTANLGQDPSLYSDAAAVNLYYNNNFLHDIHFAYGFTEAAGNFQTKNYTGQGRQNDSVQAMSQFGRENSQFNNASFTTPPDGQPPTMKMFLFNLTNPLRDADFDNQVIIHEFGHGVSNRLTGGPANADALQALQSRGMGEGWSDFWAMAFTARPTDKGTDKQTIATYLLGQPSTGPGIRKQPYSTDIKIDTHTLNDLPLLKEEHEIGEIWASTLWDLHWNLVDRYGFQADYKPSSKGNSVALSLIENALKLQPANPTFLQARDAILLADQMFFKGANQDLIWKTFARRGMGFSAVDKDANSNQVTPAFDVPGMVSAGTVSGVVFVDANGDGIQNPGEKGLANQTVFLDLNGNGIRDMGRQTFSSGNLGTPIPDPGTITAFGFVPLIFANVTKVTATINIRHPFVNDLTVALFSPPGIFSDPVGVFLANHVPLRGANFTATMFDDDSPVALASGAAPFTGVFQSFNKLSRFKGVDANGFNQKWALSIENNRKGNKGFLDNWSFTIFTDSDEPAAVTGSDGSFKLMGVPLDKAATVQLARNSSSFKTFTKPTDGKSSVTLTSAKPSSVVNFGVK